MNLEDVEDLTAAIPVRLAHVWGWPGAAVLVQMHHKAGYDGSEDGWYEASAADVARLTGLSRDQARREMKKLHEAGAVERQEQVDNHGQGKNLYRPTFNPRTELGPHGDSATPGHGDSATPGGGDSATPTSSREKRDKRTKKRTSPDVEVFSEDVVELCDYLATKIEIHRGGENRPKVTKAWLNDMDKLLRLGPGGVAEHYALSRERVERAIEFVFEQMADRSSSGFCWADQIQSPGSLRAKWVKIYEQAKAAGSRQSGSQRPWEASGLSARDSLGLLRDQLQRARDAAPDSSLDQKLDWIERSLTEQGRGHECVIPLLREHGIGKIMGSDLWAMQKEWDRIWEGRK